MIACFSEQLFFSTKLSNSYLELVIPKYLDISISYTLCVLSKFKVFKFFSYIEIREKQYSKFEKESSLYQNFRGDNHYQYIKFY